MSNETLGSHSNSGSISNTDRHYLSSYRVIQRDLVYVLGIPIEIANEETLRSYEYFGQYGPIKKIVVNNLSLHTSPNQTVSVYVTFENIENAWECIYALKHFQYNDRYVLRSSFGTLKYCPAFLNGQECKKTECMYMHSEGSPEDSFSNNQIQQDPEKFVKMTTPELPKDYQDYQFKTNPPTIFPPRRILSSSPIQEPKKVIE